MLRDGMVALDILDSRHRPITPKRRELGNCPETAYGKFGRIGNGKSASHQEIKHRRDAHSSVAIEDRQQTTYLQMRVTEGT
jgi:hypothetical protein